jgi:hypothetical protein
MQLQSTENQVPEPLRTSSTSSAFDRDPVQLASSSTGLGHAQTAQQLETNTSVPPHQAHLGNSDILDLSDESGDDEPPDLPLHPELKAWYATEEKRSTLATEPELMSRQLHTPWAGSDSPPNWICRPQERHIHQVDQDRRIPASFGDTFPRYVRRFPVSKFPLPNVIQAICPAEMKYFHSFLESRYRFNDLRDYQHLLGLFRNTQAVEAIKSRQRHSEIEDLGRMLRDLRVDINSILDE